MAASAENSNTFTGPTIPWSSVIPTLWRIISGRVSDSQVRWWRIRILLVGAAVTGTDQLSIYPFTGVPLAFSSFLFCYFFISVLLIFVIHWFFSFSFISVLLIFELFIDFSSSFFLSLLYFLYFILFYPHLFFLFFTLCLSSSTLYHLCMRILVMSIDSNFVFEFIARVMVIMLVHSTCQSVSTYAHSYMPCMSRRLSKACAWECPLFSSGAFSLSS